MILAAIAIALYGIITAKNLIRKVMCLNIIQSVIIMMFLATGHTAGGAAPILRTGEAIFVDPLPQALMLTSIVIGVCFNSIAVAFIVKIYRQYGTIETTDLHER